MARSTDGDRRQIHQEVPIRAQRRHDQNREQTEAEKIDRLPRLHKFTKNQIWGPRQRQRGRHFVDDELQVHVGKWGRKFQQSKFFAAVVHKIRRLRLPSRLLDSRLQLQLSQTCVGREQRGGLISKKKYRFLKILF